MGVPTTPTQPTALPTSPTPVVVVTPTPQASPTSEPDTGINITQKDYDDAIARWRAADVREYEIVANHMFVYAEMSGDWKLRVRDGRIIEIWRGDVRLYLDNESGLLNPEANPSNLAFLTVESQFETIRKILEDPASRGLVLGGERYEVEYQIKFNGTLGYPERYAIYPLTITDNERLTQIKSLRVIEQGPNATITFTPAPPETTPTGAVPDTSTSPKPGPEVVIEKGSPASQKAYDDALAKWRAAGVMEYEVTARIEGEGIEQEWTLQVKGSDVTVISSTEGLGAGTGDLDFIIADKQFALMADVLAGNDDPGIKVEGIDLHMTYVVQFDTELGYPARFEMRMQPGPVYDLGYMITVKSFRRISPK